MRFFLKIEESQLINLDYFNENITNIRFSYKGMAYFLGTKIDKNQNEKGKVPFRRIETFHPIEELVMLKELKDHFELFSIDEELQLYIKK